MVQPMNAGMRNAPMPAGHANDVVLSMASSFKQPVGELQHVGNNPAGGYTGPVDEPVKQAGWWVAQSATVKGLLIAAIVAFYVVAYVGGAYVIATTPKMTNHTRRQTPKPPTPFKNQTVGRFSKPLGGFLIFGIVCIALWVLMTVLIIYFVKCRGGNEERNFITEKTRRYQRLVGINENTSTTQHVGIKHVQPKASPKSQDPPKSLIDEFDL